MSEEDKPDELAVKQKVGRALTIVGFIFAFGFAIFQQVGLAFIFGVIGFAGILTMSITPPPEAPVRTTEAPTEAPTPI